MTERDPLLKRLERHALGFCLAAIVTSVVARGGRMDVALGVAGGGLLIAAGYLALKRGLDGCLGAIGLPAGPPAPPAAAAGGEVDTATADLADTVPATRIHKGKLAWALAMFVGRYALLGLMAYVMIARLRLHPIGLIMGASSIVAAASIEALRIFWSGRS